MEELINTLCEVYYYSGFSLPQNFLSILVYCMLYNTE